MHYVTKLEEVNGFSNDLIKTDVISLDIESTGLDAWEDDLLLVQAKVNNEIYIFDAKKLGSKTIRYIVSLINDSKKECIGHNIKFDIKFLERKTGELITNIYDTMVIEQVLHAGVMKKMPSLDELVEKYIGITLDKSVRKTFIDAKEITQEQLIYAASDVNHLEEIKKKQLEDAEKNNLRKVVDLENMLLPVVASMEINGVKLNQEHWLNLEKVYIRKEKETRKDFIEYAIKGTDFSKFKNAIECAEYFSIPVKNTIKETEFLTNLKEPEFLKEWFRDNFNIGSPYQVKAVLRNITGLDIKSTGERVLTPYKHDNEVVSLLLDFREAAKKVSTYGAVWLQHVNKYTGRVHAEFNQMGTATGRFSCVPLDTEILTTLGWKKYNEVSKGDKVIGFDIQTQEYTITTIRDIVVGKDYVGKLKANYSNDSNFIVGPKCTSNHKWIVKNDTIIGYAEASKIPNNFRVLLQPKKEFPNIDKSVLDPTQAYLLGWYLTDGFLTGKVNHGLGINLAKKRSIKLLFDYLDSNNIEYTVNKYKQYKNDSHYITAFHISSKIFEPIFEIFKSLSPSNLIMSLNIESKRAMFDAMLEGDGSMRREKKRYDRFGALETQYKNTCDYFELLSVSLGQPYNRRISTTRQGKKFVNYYLLQNENYANKNYRWKPEEFVDIWCPVTECGTWVMRQEHSVYITGNSDTPNMQNIPADSDDTPDEESYRAAFQPEEGNVLITSDYSQAELRLLAVVSGEQELIGGFIRGDDAHKVAATKLYHIPIEEVTKDQRRRGKTLNFSVVYGTSIWGLLFNFGIPINEGTQLLEDYFTGFNALDKFINLAGNKIVENLYSITPYGRKRFFEKRIVFADNKDREKYIASIKREGINHIIQGGSADMVKLAMIKIFYGNPFGDKLKILLQVHDEIVCEVAKDIAEDARKFILKCMQSAGERFLGEVPAVVDSKISYRWAH